MKKKRERDKSVKHFEAGDVQDIKVSSTYIFIFCNCRPEIVYDRHTDRPLQPVPSPKTSSSGAEIGRVRISISIFAQNLN